MANDNTLGDKHWVVVGLGNPGKQYERTRHNIGFLVVDAVAKKHGIEWREEKAWHARVARTKLGSSILHLLQPLTFMNESGRAVKAYLEFYKLGPHNVLIVCDDIALPFGMLRLRNSGSTGGHNGLRSLTFALHTSHYARLRMGIDGERGMLAMAEFVLSSFAHKEQLELPNFIARAVDAIEAALVEDIEKVMNRVNTRKRSGENTV